MAQRSAAMSRSLARDAEFWSMVVAEAKEGAISRVAFAAKHGCVEVPLVQVEWFDRGEGKARFCHCE